MDICLPHLFYSLAFVGVCAGAVVGGGPGAGGDLFLLSANDKKIKPRSKGGRSSATVRRNRPRLERDFLEYDESNISDIKARYEGGAMDNAESDDSFVEKGDSDDEESDSPLAKHGVDDSEDEDEERSLPAVRKKRRTGALSDDGESSDE